MMVQSPCPDWLSKPRLINAVAAGRRLLIFICCAAASRPPKPRDSADLPANKPTDASGVLSTSHFQFPDARTRETTMISVPRAGAKVRESNLCIRRIDSAHLRERFMDRRRSHPASSRRL